jgi:hypothetical protein
MGGFRYVRRTVIPDSLNDSLRLSTRKPRASRQPLAVTAMAEAETVVEAGDQ